MKGKFGSDLCVCVCVCVCMYVCFLDLPGSVAVVKRKLSHCESCVLLVFCGRENLQLCVCVLSCVRLSVTHMDCSSPGSSVHGIFPARTLEWVISLTQGLKPCLLRLLHWQTDSLPLCHLGSPSLQLGRKCLFFLLSPNMVPNVRLRVAISAAYLFTAVMWKTATPGM